MKTVKWRSGEPVGDQLEAWLEVARTPGLLHLVFEDPRSGDGPSWSVLEPWTRTRAVTVAEIGSSLSPPSLDVALCSDLVYIHRGAELLVNGGEPTAGLIWALGRAGRAALARGLLDGAPIPSGEVVRLGLAQRVLGAGESPMVAEDASTVALTTARDLMRSSLGARSALELAAFKLLFASGDPGEGARAFLERRKPEFDD